MNQHAPWPYVEATPKPKTRKGLTVAIAAGTFLLGLMFGSLPTADEPARAATTSAPHVPYVPDVQQVPAPAPADGSISNGIYEIGDEVAPGKYKSPGPDGGVIKLCYVDVQRGEKFLLQEISNDGQVRITIPASMVGAEIEVSGCAPFTKVA